MIYIPKRVLFEEKSLDYPIGKNLYKIFNNKDTEIHILKSNRVTQIPGDSPLNQYVEGKNSLVIRVRKNQEFQSCKPSAHYQLPLLSGCAGKCEYCYLNTRFGNKPYTTIYVNVDDILQKVKSYIEERKPELTLFEAAATSDPIPFEQYTGSLRKAIEFIGNEEMAKLRLVTKFSQIDSLLGIKHNGRTTIRFSINSKKIIDEYEHGTSSLKDRIDASKRILDDGYNIGFIIGPIIIYENWKNNYLTMLNELRDRLGQEIDSKISFEVISHRFTTAAKNKILEIFPNTTLPMTEEGRKYKYGQFGYGKYVYEKDSLEDMKLFFKDNIKTLFPKGEIEYII